MRFALVFCLLVSLSAVRADDVFGYGDLGSTPVVPLTWEKIAAALTDARKPLSSVEDLLRWISETHPAFLENFTLMRESRSSQGASGRHPRAIVFQRDGKLVLTFNGDASQAGHERVELIQFREPKKDSPVGSHFEFREIEFRNGKPILSEANPNRCQQCHESNLRPIWPPYEIWPGAYGKYDDALPDYVNDKYAFTGGQSEAQIREETEALHDYRRYSPEWRKHARYSYLRFPEGSPVTPYNPQRRGKDRFRPNLHLTHLVSQLHAKTVAGKLAENEECFAQYRPLLVGALLGCGAEGYGFKKEMEAQLVAAGERLRESYPGAEKAGGRYRYDVDDRLPDLLALMGIEKEHWNPDFNPAVWHYYVGIADIAGLVADGLYPLARLADPKLPEFEVAKDYLIPAVYGDGRANYDEEPEKLPPSKHELVCRVLGERVAHLKPSAQACRRAPAHGALQMCASCHEGQVAGAPSLPLTEPDRLKEDPALVQRIVDRVNREGAGAMPPTRRLTNGERREISEYLRALH